ncbi:hypothetical protein [Microbispora sp. NPDC046933]
MLPPLDLFPLEALPRTVSGASLHLRDLSAGWIEPARVGILLA